MDIVLLNDGIAAGNTTCAIEMVSMTPGNGQSQAADNVTVTGWFNGSDLKGPFRLQNEVSCSESRPKWICGAASRKASPWNSMPNTRGRRGIFDFHLLGFERGGGKLTAQLAQSQLETLKVDLRTIYSRTRKVAQVSDSEGFLQKFKRISCKFRP